MTDEDAKKLRDTCTTLHDADFQMRRLDDYKIARRAQEYIRAQQAHRAECDRHPALKNEELEA